MVEQGSSTERTVLIIIAVIVIVVVVIPLLLVCACLFCNFMIGGCTLLGPGISDIFSEINSSLVGTPVP